jgi:hypothetical protein
MEERSILKSKSGMVPHPPTLKKGLARWIPTFTLLFSYGFLFSEEMEGRNKKGQKVYFADYPFKAVIFKNFLFTTKCPWNWTFGDSHWFFPAEIYGPELHF